jgi:hypothetical protein
MSDEEFISKVDGDLLVCDDGFVKYWPSGPGYLTEHQLRLIADELKKRNAKWKAYLDSFFEVSE